MSHLSHCCCLYASIHLYLYLFCKHCIHMFLFSSCTTKKTRKNFPISFFFSLHGFPIQKIVCPRHHQKKGISSAGRERRRPDHQLSFYLSALCTAYTKNIYTTFSHIHSLHSSLSLSLSISYHDRMKDFRFYVLMEHPKSTIHQQRKNTI